MNTPLKISLSLIVAAMTLASIYPLYWQSYLLHQFGTVVLICPMIYLYLNQKISSVSLYAMTIFLLLHIVGARWSYSYVPYNDWSKALFNSSIDNLFGFHRNMYDRLVHFGFGVFCYPIIYDLCKKYFYPNHHKQLLIIALLINIACSMLYELFEWGLAISLSEQDAENYNGQQGDIWDAHKDMALALLGAVICAFFYPNKRLKYHSSPQ